MRIIAGANRGTVILAPSGLDTRPTLDRVRENLFNILGLKVRNARVLDLFAGSGALSFESLSRGAEYAVLCDHQKEAIKCINANAAKLRLTDKVEIHQKEWSTLMSLLSSRGDKFQIVFLDPPYAMTDLTDVMTSLIPVINEDTIIVSEHPSNSFPTVPDGFYITDSRKYGIAGLSFFQYRR